MCQVQRIAEEEAWAVEHAEEYAATSDLDDDDDHHHHGHHGGGGAEQKATRRTLKAALKAAEAEARGAVEGRADRLAAAVLVVGRERAALARAAELVGK